MRRLEDLLRGYQRFEEGRSAVPTNASLDAFATIDDSAGTCPRCRGAGFVRRNVPLGDPNFGRAVACSCAKDESEEERRSRLDRYSNLGALTRYTFDSLTLHGPGRSPPQQERYQRAVLGAKQFADHPEGWLVLTGESGSGKTHIAAAIANHALAAGNPTLFMVVPDLLDHLRGAYSPDSELTYDRLFDQVRNAPLLVLDDLGMHSSTPWAEEKLYQLVNHRFSLGLATVFTLAGQVDALDERMRSRLTDPATSRVYVLEVGTVSQVDIADPLALPLLRGMTFASFDHRATGPDRPDAVARKLKDAYDQARNFAQHPDGWLVFAGETGCGKTHLAAAIAHHQRELGRSYVFVGVPDMLDRLRGEMRAESPRDGRDFLDRVRTCEFLVLDDLGVHSDTPWAQEKLFQILNYRYNAKLPTVITVRPSDELPASLRSRLYDDKVSMFWQIDAPDYRNPERPRSVQKRRTSQQR